MAGEILSVFVEGADDERFVQQVLEPEFRHRYLHLRCWRYAQELDSKTDNFLKNLKSQQAPYLFLTDMDRSSCFTEKKRQLRQHFPHLDEGRVVVVKRMIEGWYLAGLDEQALAGLKVQPGTDAEEVTKDQFDRLIPACCVSRAAFLVQILDHYQVAVARERNASLRYLLDRHCGLAQAEALAPDRK